MRRPRIIMATQMRNVSTANHLMDPRFRTPSSQSASCFRRENPTVMGLNKDAQIGLRQPLGKLIQNSRPAFERYDLHVGNASTQNALPPRSVLPGTESQCLPAAGTFVVLPVAGSVGHLAM